LGYITYIIYHICTYFIRIHIFYIYYVFVSIISISKYYYFGSILHDIIDVTLDFIKTKNVDVFGRWESDSFVHETYLVIITIIVIEIN